MKEIDKSIFFVWATPLQTISVPHFLIFSFDTQGDFPYAFGYSDPPKRDIYQSIDRGGL
jgi:hypothetical protein